MGFSVVYTVVSDKVPAAAENKMVFVSGLSENDAIKVAGNLAAELKFLLGSEAEVSVEVEP